MSTSLTNRVLDAIRKGASTPGEIAEETGLSLPEVRPELIRLINDGVVERRARKPDQLTKESPGESFFFNSSS